MTTTMPHRHHTVGPKGQVVIPKAIRDELGIRPGDPVDFVLDNGAVLVRLARSGSLLGMLAGSDLVEPYLAEKAKEIDREDHRR